jgi:hypothetical protein
MILSPPDLFDIGYQKKDVQYVFNVLQAGESCSLVAMGSVGKSNLLQFLTQDYVTEHYLHREEASHWVMVLVDPHEMVCLQGDALAQAGDHWAGYEIMLSRLHYALMRLYNSDALGPQTDEQKKDLNELFEMVGDCHEDILQPNPLSQQIGLRHLEEALYEILSRDDNWRIVFLFDEVGEMLNLLPPEFFQSLRGLRDSFKRRVMYVAASRRPLDDLCDEIADREADPRIKYVLEGFYELFREFTYYISPLDYESFKATVEGYYNRHADRIPSLGEWTKEDLTRELFAITGGHAGLVRRSFLTAVSLVASGQLEEPLGHYLLYDDAVNKECETIFLSLPRAERIEMNLLAHDKPIDDKVLRSLCAKHLIVLDDEDRVVMSDNGAPKLRLGILREFILHNPHLTRKDLSLPS